MVKQKVVMKVQMDDPKNKTKVMKLVAKHPGISSIEIDEDGKISVVGDGIDPIKLIGALRKQSRYAEIVAVSPAGEKKEDDEKDKAADVLFLAAPPPFVYDLYGVPPEPVQVQPPLGCFIL